METFLLIGALVIIVGTFVPLLRRDTWIVRVWDFPRVQLFWLSLPVLIALVFTGDWADPLVLVAIIGLFTATVSMAVWMWPYTKMAQSELRNATDSGEILKIMVSNVLMTNRDHRRFLERVDQADPDFLVAIETDQWWKRKNRYTEPSISPPSRCPSG